MKRTRPDADKSGEISNVEFKNNQSFSKKSKVRHNETSKLAQNTNYLSELLDGLLLKKNMARIGEKSYLNRIHEAPF